MISSDYVTKGPFTLAFLNRFEIETSPNETNVNSHKRSENEFDPIGSIPLQEVVSIRIDLVRFPVWTH